MSYLETEINEESANEHFYKDEETNFSEEDDSGQNSSDTEEEITSPNGQDIEDGTKNDSDTNFNEEHKDKSKIPFGRGFGGCYKCACKAFEGNGDICGNCYHHYNDHC